MVAEGRISKLVALSPMSKTTARKFLRFSFCADGTRYVYIAAGGKNPAGQFPNPTSNPAGVEQAVWSIAWGSGEPKKIDAGHSPVVSATGAVAYARDGQLWLAPFDASAKPLQIVVRGQNGEQQWSPDGKLLAFASTRVITASLRSTTCSKNP